MVGRCRLGPRRREWACLLDQHGPPDLRAKVEGGGTFNGVLIPPIHIDGGSAWRRECSDESTPYRAGRDGGEGSEAYRGARYGDG